MISLSGDRISLRMHHEYFVHGQNFPFSSVVPHSRLTPFSTCWNVGPCLYFLGVSIVQFIGLPGSFSGLICLHLSDAQFKVMVTVGSAWVVS